MKKLLAILLALALVLSLAACAKAPEGEETPSDTQAETPAEEESEPSSSSDEETIKIGVNNAFTGGSAAGGELEGRGIELAYKYRDTVLGKPVEIINGDNKTDKVEAATVTTKLIDSDGVCAVIGSYGSALTMASAEILKDREVVGMACSATNPNVTAGNPWQFRVCFIDTYQGQVMAQYAFDQGYTKIGILRELTNDFCVGLASYFADTFTALTGDENSVTVVDFQTGDQEFTSQITTLMQEEPDAIFIPFPTNIGDIPVIAKQMHQLGYEVPLLSSDGCEVQDLIDVGGEDVENLYFTTFFDTEMQATDATKLFLERYAETYGEDAVPSAFEVLAYDSYNIILDAIEAAGSADPQDIQAALKAMENWEGAGGTVTFDENNNPNKPAVIKVIKDGKFQYVDTVELASES